MERSNAESQRPEKSHIAFRETRTVLALLCLSLPSSAWAQSGTGAKPDSIKAEISRVDGDFIKANTKTSWDWPTVGLDYAETRFSKLNQINTDNVGNLGLVWSYNLGSSRGIEATPLVVDGIMYQPRPGTWSMPLTRGPGQRSGRSIQMSTGQRPIGGAATLSAVVLPSTTARSSSPPMTDA